MKTLVLTTQQLKQLGLIKTEEPKLIRIVNMEKKTNGKGYVILTNDKTLSKTGLFQLLNNQMYSAISAATEIRHSTMNDTDILASDVRQFKDAINSTADISKNMLKIVYHKTIKKLAFKANKALAEMFAGVAIDEDVELNEGWEDIKSGERNAFEGDTRTNSNSFMLSNEAMNVFEKSQQAVVVAIKINTLEAIRAGVKPAQSGFKPMDKPVEKEQQEAPLNDERIDKTEQEQEQEQEQEA